jgi:hypothetical protein
MDRTGFDWCLTHNSNACRPCARVYMGNLAWSIDEDAIKQAFEVGGRHSKAWHFSLARYLLCVKTHHPIIMTTSTAI